MATPEIPKPSTSSSLPSIKTEGDMVRRMLDRINLSNAENGIDLGGGAMTPKNVGKALLGSLKNAAVDSMKEKAKEALKGLFTRARTTKDIVETSIDNPMTSFGEPVALTETASTQGMVDTLFGKDFDSRSQDSKGRNIHTVGGVGGVPAVVSGDPTGMLGDNFKEEENSLSKELMWTAKYFDEQVKSDSRNKRFSLSTFRKHITARLSRNQYFLLDIPYLYTFRNDKKVNKSADAWRDQYLSALARSVSTPSVSQGTTVVPYKGQDYKMADKTVYSDINVTFLCEEDGTLRQNLLTWMELAYQVDTANWGFPEDYKFDDIKITQLTADANYVTSETRLYGAWPTNVASLSFDHAGGNFLTFDVTFSFDYAKISRVPWDQ